MSYAAMAKKNAPPEEEQPHPSQALLDGGFKGDTHTGLPDVDEKLAVVDRDWIKHPETSTSLHANTSTTGAASSLPPLHPAAALEPHVSEVAPTPLPTPHAPKTDDPIPAEQVEKLKKEAAAAKKAAEKEAAEIADAAKKEGKQVKKEAERAGEKVKDLASKGKAEAKDLAAKGKAEAKELGKKARAELDEAETAIAKYYEKSKDVILRPGVLGGLMGVVNVGLLSTIGYFAYTRKDQPWDRRIVSGAVAGTLALFGAEGVVADKYINTDEGRAEAQRAKEEGSKVYLQVRETVLRPGVAGGLVGIVNLAVLGTVGYFSYKHWNMRVWDRKVVGGVAAGLVALSGVEGFVGNYYKENELPRQKRKGNF